MGALRAKRSDHNYVFTKHIEETFLVAVEGLISVAEVHISLFFFCSQNIPKLQPGRDVPSDISQTFAFS